MVTVSVDAMGGDHAPNEIIKGVIEALNQEPDLAVLLTGPVRLLTQKINEYADVPDRLSIIDAPEIIGSDEQPTVAMRKKKKSSMMVAIDLVKEKKAQAVVSAGNTGAFMAGSLLKLGRLPGIDRPALATLLPGYEGGNVVLLDVGAHMDASPINLLQYALMGKVYCNKVLGIKEPRLALLNIGIEDAKGNDMVKKTYALLKSRDSNFVGNMEARDFNKNIADVIVCDGFVGNVMLKTAEGVAEELFYKLQELFTADLTGKLCGSLMKSRLKKIKDKMDYAEYGGAPFLGVQGLSIKSHGSSKSKAIKNALLKQAYRFIDEGGNETIQTFVQASKEDIERVDIR